jgi:F420-non-reducing hydrogenase iron-sulfur subunit
LRAKQKVQQAKVLLKEAGIEPERVEMFNIGASEAVLFAKACDEMTERARKLGPNPLKRKRVN